MRSPRHRSRRRAFVSRLLGTPVLTADGSRLAEVVDLHVRLRSGRVTRVVVTFEDGGERKLGSIPWDMVTPTADGFVTVASREYLLGKAPSPGPGSGAVERGPFARPTL